MIIYLDTGEVVRTEGGYSLTITARAGDRDVYAVSLSAGDVLGVSVADAAGYVSVFEASGTGGARLTAGRLVRVPGHQPAARRWERRHRPRRAQDGTHFVEVTSGDGRYSADLEVYRYGGAAKKQTQTVFWTPTASG
jgi:hypothetical protein